MDGQPDDDIYCAACGERIRRSANFCRYCGAPNRYGDGAEGVDRRPPGTEPGRTPPGERPHPREDDTDEWGDPPEVTDRVSAQDDEAHEPWETDYARRVESRIDDGNDDSNNGDKVNPWREFLPDVARQRSESKLAVFGTAAGLGILGVALLIIVTIATVSIGTAMGFSQTSMGVLGTLVGQYIGFAGLALWYLRRRGFSWDHVKRYLGVEWPTLKQLGIVVGSWFVILALLIVIGLSLEVITDVFDMGDPDEPEQALDDIIADNPELVPAAILVMFLVVGPCEELLFRGVVQGRLREKFTAVPAILLASALFAGVHVIALAGSLQAIILGIFVLFSTSLVIGAVYEYTKSIVVAALLHGFHNSMVTLIIAADAIYDLEGVLSFLVLLPL